MASDRARKGKVTVPVFYAQGRLRGPLIASLVAVVCNLAVALATHPYLQWRGLALAVGVGQAANWLVLTWMLRSTLQGVGRRLVGHAIRLGIAAGVCGLAAWATAEALPRGDGWGARGVGALVPVVVGALAYLGTAWICGAKEALALLDSPRNRDYTP